MSPGIFQPTQGRPLIFGGGGGVKNKENQSQKQNKTKQKQRMFKKLFARSLKKQSEGLW